MRLAKLAAARVARQVADAGLLIGTVGLVLAGARELYGDPHPLGSGEAGVPIGDPVAAADEGLLVVLAFGGIGAFGTLP